MPADLFILLIVIIYTYSFMEKVLDHDQFTMNLLSSPLISDKYVGLLRYAVPAAELMVLIGVFFFTKRTITYHYTFFLSAVFTAYYVFFFLLTRNSKCGCGKLIESLGFLPHLLLINLPLVLCSLFLIFYSDRLRQQQPGKTDSLFPGLS
jgi:hypothetical protein